MQQVVDLPDLEKIEDEFRFGDEHEVMGTFVSTLHSANNILLGDKETDQAWAAEFWHMVLWCGVCDKLQSRYKECIANALKQATFKKKWESGTQSVIGNWGSNFFTRLSGVFMRLPPKPSVEFCEDLGKISQKHTVETFVSQMESMWRDGWCFVQFIDKHGARNYVLGHVDLRRYITRYIDGNNSLQLDGTIAPAMSASYTVQLSAETQSVLDDGVSEPNSSVDKSSVDTAQLDAAVPSVMDDGMSEPDPSVDTSSGSPCVPPEQQLKVLLSAISSGIGQNKAVVNIKSLYQAAKKAREQAAEILRIAEADVRGSTACNSDFLVDEIAKATAEEAKVAKKIRDLEDSHEETAAYSESVRRELGHLVDNSLYTALQKRAADWKARGACCSEALDKVETAEKNAAKLTAKANYLESVAKKKMDFLKETVVEFAEHMNGAIDAAMMD